MLLLVLMGHLGHAQDMEQMERPPWYHEVLATAKIGFLAPTAHGSNFLADGYDTWNGIHLDAKAYFKEKTGIGVQLQYFKGRVVDQELVGAIDASRINHSLVYVSYNPFSRESDWLFEVNAGLGWIDIRNEKGEQRFNDSGFALMAGVELSYRLDTWIGIYVMVQNNWGFLHIDTAKEIEDDFNTIQTFSPSIGFKFYIL